MPLDPYEQLGVAHDATAAQIKSAWRSKVQQMHPDKHPDDPFAETRYAHIRESYDILSDPARRAAYDKDGLTKLDDLPQRARAYLEAVVVELLKQASSSGHIGELDLVFSLQRAITDMRAQNQREHLQTQRVVRGLEKQLKRVRRKGKGENLLGDLISVRVEEARKRSKQLANAIQECGAALAMLDDYEDIDLNQLGPALLSRGTNV